MKKNIIVFFLFIICLAGAFGAGYSATWEAFYAYSSLAAPDDSFPVVEAADIALAEPGEQAELVKTDGNGDGRISVDEYFEYHTGNPEIAPLLKQIDAKSNGKALKSFSAILKNLSAVEYRVGSDVYILFPTIMKYYGAVYLGGSNFISFLGQSIYRLPNYFRGDFFSLYNEILSDSNGKKEFEDRYGRLSDLLIRLVEGKDVDAGTAGSVKNDLSAIEKIYKSYGFSACVQLYAKLNNQFFGTGRRSGGEITRNIERAFNTFGDIMDVAEGAGTKHPSETIIDAAAFVAGLFFNQGGGNAPLGKNRQHVSDDWKIIVGFLKAENGGGTVIDELGHLLSGIDAYFSVRPHLETYLDTYFKLQYETDLPLSRIIPLFVPLAEVYPDSVVETTSAEFAAHPSFIYKNGDDDIFNIIHLCFSKTERIFKPSFRYVVDQSGPTDLYTIIGIYSALSAGDLEYLVNVNLPLEKLDRVIEEYDDSLAFYLPLFAGLYGENGKDAGIFKTIDATFPFHTALSMDEIRSLRSLWGSLFDSRFLTLLETAAAYPSLMMPLGASKKDQLFKLFRMAGRYSVDYKNLLLFNLDVYGEAGFENSAIDFFDELFNYTAGDKEAGIIYAAYYVNILKKLILKFGVKPFNDHAYLLMDLAMLNTYEREKVALVFQTEIPFLKEISNLYVLKEISAESYSPDVFISLNRTSVPFGGGNMDLTGEFISDFITKGPVNRELFEYGLVEVNKLFPVNEVYSKKTLLTIYHLIDSLSPEKRKTLISSLSKIAYLKKTITSPDLLNDSVDVLEQLDQLESDLYDELFLQTIPEFNRLIESAYQLVTIFKELESSNQHLASTVQVLEGIEKRDLFFTEILPMYASWVNSISEIQNDCRSMVLPLEVWIGEGGEYLGFLKSVFPSVFGAHKDHDFTAFFSSVSRFIDLSDKQSSAVSALGELKSAFFAENDISLLVDYLSAVKDKSVAVENGKKIYLTFPDKKIKKSLDRLINNTFKGRSAFFPGLAAAAAYQFGTGTFMVGGAGILNIHFSGSYLNYFAPALYIDLQYLYDITGALHEITPGLGFLFPLGKRGAAGGVDNLFCLNLGAGYNIHFDGSSPYQQALFKFGIKSYFDILQQTRIGVSAEYQLLYGADVGTNQRVGVGVEWFLLR